MAIVSYTANIPQHLCRPMYYPGPFIAGPTTKGGLLWRGIPLAFVSVDCNPGAAFCCRVSTGRACTVWVQHQDRVLKMNAELECHILLRPCDDVVNLNASKVWKEHLTAPASGCPPKTVHRRVYVLVQHIPELKEVPVS